MAASEIGLLSMTQIQKLSPSPSTSSQHPQPNPNSSSTTTTTTSATWMWNPSSRENHREEAEEDESWEVRAFAEDTRNIMGTTWPPRSYTCTFCRREFRSAQALGGHMNVHRRDRARLHQVHPPSTIPSHPTPPFINIPPHHQDLGLCLLYHLPSPNSTTVPNLNVNGESPSTLLSISPYQPNNLMMQTCSSPSFNFPLAQVSSPHINGSVPSYFCNSTTKLEQPPTLRSIDNGHLEELDLELRLGHKATPT